MKKTLAFCFLTISIWGFSQVKEDTINKEKSIEGVTLVVKKPTVETKIDRTVFNVSNSSILAGNTTWDVLRMTPLVSIDNNDVVKSEGENVTVYINDRKTVFTGKELKEYLKSIPADNLLKIEVITNPSSRYETTGQVINIVLKKREDEGIKGSVSMTNTQNTKNNQYSSFNVNYHKKSFTETLTGSYNDNTNVSSSKQENTIFENNEFRKVDQKSTNRSKMPSLSSTSEFELNEKNNLGVIVELFQNKSLSNNISNGESFLNNVPNNTYVLNQNETERYSNINSNIFYKFYDKAKNRIFDVNLGVNYNTDKSNRDYTKNQIIAPIVDENHIFENTQMRNYYLKLDYSQPLDTLGSSIEAGAKFDFNNNSSPIDYYGFKYKDTNGDIVSKDLFNRFSYKDNLNAVYANYSAKFFKKLDVRIGLRYEYITFTIQQKTDNLERKDSYGTLLPNALLKYTFTPNFNISAAYNKNIWRPWYTEFNPFELPTSDGNFYRGNMNLEPNPSQRYTMKFGIYKKYFISLNYWYTNQDYWSVYESEPKGLVEMPINFNGRSEKYSINFNTNQTFFKNKLNVNLNIGYNYTDNSDFNTKNNTGAKNYLNNINGSANFSYTNLFDKNINLSAWVGVYQQNNGNSLGNKTNVYHNLSITKIFTKLGMEASIQLNNIFLRPVFDRTTYSAAGTFRSIYRSDWYGGGLTITKRFGNQKVKENTKTDVEKNSGGGK